MADQSFTGIGYRNITGSHSLNNVGNQTTYNFLALQRQTNSLESRVSYDALLNSTARDPVPRCHASTRKEVQKIVKNWLCGKKKGLEKGIMWMSGAPGVGKSAIVQTVCDELCGGDGSRSWLSRIYPRHQDVEGSFFFRLGMENREKASCFPTTIAYQLCLSRPSLHKTIHSAIEQKPHVFDEDFGSQFRCLLIKPAQSISFLQGPVTVVIDGLDDCNSAADQVRLLELILEGVKTGNMRFLIASLPEHHICNFFRRRDVSRHTCHIPLDDDAFNTSQDIKTFLREEFARIRQERLGEYPRLPDGQEWPGDHIIDHLTVKSDSQFMFPVLAIDFIDTPHSPPDKQLQILLADPPPGTFSALDALYHKILSRRLPVKHMRGEDDLREYQEVVMGVLRVIVAWPGEPLSAAQIAVVLDKPVEVVQNIVRGPMRCLFKFYPLDHNSPITLCQNPLKDFLLDHNRSKEFFIPSAGADDLISIILSRPRSYPTILADVLATVAGACEELWCVARIAEFLGVALSVVEEVVNVGPTNFLFTVDKDGVDFCGSLDFRRYYLKTSGRSGIPVV